MIRRKGAYLSSQLCSTPWTQLICMDLWFQTVFLPGLENLSRLFKGKGLLFTEDIAKFCKPFLCNPGNYFLNEKIDIASPSISEFFWNGVGPQKGGDDLDGMNFLQCLRHPENFHLVVEGKSVSAFCLYRGHPLGKHPVQSFLSKEKKFIEGGLSGGLNRCKDSSSPLGNFQIRETLNSLLEFILSGTGKDEVGMGINEPRHHHLSGGVNFLTSCA